MMPKYDGLASHYIQRCKQAKVSTKQLGVKKMIKLRQFMRHFASVCRHKSSNLYGISFKA